MTTYTTHESASVTALWPRRVSASTLWLSWPATKTQMPSTLARIAEPERREEDRHGHDRQQLDVDHDDGDEQHAGRVAGDQPTRAGTGRAPCRRGRRAIVPHRPTNLPVMNAARLTGLEKSTNTVRFSTSLCTRLAATNTATMRPKNGDRDQAEVLHHAALLAEADAAQPEAADDHDEREDDDHGEHAVADRLLEGVDGDGDAPGSRRDHLHEEVLERRRLGQRLVHASRSRRRGLRA